MICQGGGADVSEIKKNCVKGLEKGRLCKDCRAYHGRKQMNSVKDSRNVKKNSGAVQKCCKTLSLLFLRELFQVIQCSQGEAANHALDLANPRESQLLSAWSNQKGRRLDGGMTPPRVSVHHVLKWRCWWSTLMPPFEVTSEHSTLSLCGWGVMSWFEVPQEGLFIFVL